MKNQYYDQRADNWFKITGILTLLMVIGDFLISVLEIKSDLIAYITITSAVLAIISLIIHAKFELEDTQEKGIKLWP